jgi:hypothetical protein
MERKKQGEYYEYTKEWLRYTIDSSTFNQTWQHSNPGTIPIDEE